MNDRIMVRFYDRKDSEIREDFFGDILFAERYARSIANNKRYFLQMIYDVYKDEVLDLYSMGFKYDFEKDEVIHLESEK